MLGLRHLSRRMAGARSVAGARRGFRTSTPARKEITVTVDGQNIEIPASYTVYQACEAAGVDIPRFCYHERLSVAGNCRMCLVEVEKSPKPVASCAMPVMPNMNIKTNTPLVHKAREGVMEFLLSSHPLDCPICDQGGECDLQDQSIGFGSDRSRYREFKRSVEDKNIGPLVKTVMTRCIHCTRCVRFSKEIAGVESLGTTGRGNDMEIGTYVETPFDSELSGNVIDICPVGALTSKPYAFQARPWELQHTETIDVMDAVGSNIRVDTRGSEIMRIVPRLHEDINEEWISDKSRFSYDGLKRQRLDVPLIRTGDEVKPASWQEALNTIKTKFEGVEGAEIKAIVGGHADAESIISLKDLLNKLGSNNHYHEDGDEAVDVRSDYLFNSSIAGIEDADAVLLVGTNPRMEAAMINARIRKGVRHNDLKVGYVGQKADFAYDATHLGDKASVLSKVASGSHAFSKTFAKAENPMVIVGSGALARKDAEGIRAQVAALTKKYPNLKTAEWNGVNTLQTSASSVAAKDLGFVAGPDADKTPAKIVYLLNADEYSETDIPADAFVIYQGHHGDNGAARADVILPAAAYTEKSATYVNTEGRVQRTKTATPLVNKAREDWSIIRALSEVLKAPLPFNSIQDVRNRLVDVSPTFAYIDELNTPSYTDINANGASVEDTAFAPKFENFYMTDPVSRVSKVMAQATRTLKNSSNSYAQ